MVNNHYSQYRLLALLLLAMLLHASSGTAQTFQTKSKLSEGEWYKLCIKEEGLYKLTTSSLGVLRGKDTKKIGIYGLRGGMLSEYNSDKDESDLTAYPVYVADKNSNGSFDDDDYLLFYCEGPNVWQYNNASGKFSHQTNEWCNANYCYLCLTDSSACRIERRDCMPTGGTEIGTYTAVALHEIESENPYESGRKYMGEKFSASITSRTIELSVDPIAKGTAISCTYAFGHTDDYNAAVRIQAEKGSSQNSLTGSNGYSVMTTSFTSQGNNPIPITITYMPSDNQSLGYLDYIELNYDASLSFANGQHIYYLKEADTNATYILNATNATVWDVTSPYNAYEVAGREAGGKISFRLDGGTSHKLLVYDGTQAMTVASIEQQKNQDLHSLQDIDFLIVSHPAYMSQAETIAELHRTRDGLATAVVSDEEVYNEFSSGKQDPMAIRMMLRMLKQRGEIKYLLLVGGGSYDNRNLANLDKTTVVTYESEDSFTESGSYGSDDFFGYLDLGENGTNNSNTIDVGIGRIPARNESEMNHYLQKLQNYIERRDLTDDGSTGEWRTHVALLADDADPSSPSDTAFTHDAEMLANAIKDGNGSLIVDKIYADSYIEQTGAIGSTYPDANNALKKRMDAGALLLNYIGHGSMRYIGTERYISPSDISGYANRGREAFVVTSTCTFGKYDSPDGVSGAELFLHADGGAIAVISASRPINHQERFNTNLCTKLLTTGTRAGDALREAKNLVKTSHSITLLGDPAMTLSLPQDAITVTTVNGRAVADTAADSASALSTVTIAGKVLHDGSDSVFDGTLYITVYDRESTTHTLANDNEGCEVAYTQQKSILYKGSTEVADGSFEYTFTVPLDIPFDYGTAKIYHYASNDDGADAYGSHNGLVLGGVDTSAVVTETRPKIELHISDSTFRNGGMTDANPTIVAYLSDSVGINAVGSGLGHDITATLDHNGNTTIVLNDMFEPTGNDTRHGTIRYSLSNLEEGEHSIELKAWNIFNYSSTATLRFCVSKSESKDGVDFLCYPNPATSRVYLRVEHNQNIDLSSALVEIYSQSGQKVYSASPAVADNSYVLGPIAWDFTNQAGATLRCGIYIARLQVSTTDGALITKTAKLIKKQ